MCVRKRWCERRPARRELQYSVTPTRKQFLARLDLRVRLDANDDLPTRPSAVLPNLSGTGLAGAVRSATRPER